MILEIGSLLAVGRTNAFSLEAHLALNIGLLHEMTKNSYVSSKVFLSKECMNCSEFL